jgi:hypothetical protein
MAKNRSRDENTLVCVLCGGSFDKSWSNSTICGKLQAMDPVQSVSASEMD